MKHNYTSSFQRDGEATESQKQILVDGEDQKDGLYGKDWIGDEAVLYADSKKGQSVSFISIYVSGANAVLSKLMPEIERLKKSTPTNRANERPRRLRKSYCRHEINCQ